MIYLLLLLSGFYLVVCILSSRTGHWGSHGEQRGPGLTNEGCRTDKKQSGADKVKRVEDLLAEQK